MDRSIGLNKERRRFFKIYFSEAPPYKIGEEIQAVNTKSTLIPYAYSSIFANLTTVITGIINQLQKLLACCRCLNNSRQQRIGNGQ
jgi:hypothetical protein